MDSGREDFPNDIAALTAALIAARDECSSEAIKAAHAEAELAVARAKASDDQALIAHQQLQIAKLTRQLYGPRSERTSRLLDQIELKFEELESSASEDEIAAEVAVAKTTAVAAFTRKRRARNPFPEHLPRERVVVPGPSACLCCGGGRLRKLGEDVTETLESIPRQWKVIQHVREKFTCRDCEKISQAPAPFHVISRGWAGPNLLAMILFEKFGQHQPLNRQAERYAKEGVPLSLSTLADQVGAGCGVLQPILKRIEAQVFAAERLHGDDTTIPVLAKGKTDTGRCWVYVRDDRPFGGTAPPAAMFYYSRDRAGEHPRAHLANYAGILQADAYNGYRQLYEPDRKPGPILEAACRVGGDVTIPAPHRPGRADYPHPVLRAQASLRMRRRRERAMAEAADVARAWRQNATTTNCCGDRVGRAISSKFVRAGGDTNGAAYCFPRCHSRRSAPGSSETGGRAARETDGAGFVGTIRSRRPGRARTGLSPLSGAPRPCLSATCPTRG